MTYLVGGAAALLAALLELTLVPYLDVGGAHPHLVLVTAVVATVALTFEIGLVVAVAGGLALDILGPRPLGSSILVLLLVVGAVGLSSRVLDALRLVAPVVLTGIASPLFSLGLMVVLGVAEGRPWVDDPVGVVLPGTIYDVVLAALVGPLVVSVRARVLEAERFEW
ncbi:MAG: hypothetical protein KatS3mg065_0817 [Chloroflexota bacterium]|nr:MAG: hypothetical protein KatS3mg065_0817 [Chloroflexota bacterium]